MMHAVLLDLEVRAPFLRAGDRLLAENASQCLDNV